MVSYGPGTRDRQPAQAIGQQADLPEAQQPDGTIMVGLTNPWDDLCFPSPQLISFYFLPLLGESVYEFIPVPSFLVVLLAAENYNRAKNERLPRCPNCVSGEVLKILRFSSLFLLVAFPW